MLVSFYFVEYAVELANGLAEKNQVHVVLSSDRVSKTLGGQLRDRLRKGVRCTLLSKRSWFSFTTWKSVLSILKMLFTETYDVVHLQESANPLNLLFIFFSRKPVVLTVHDVALHPGSEASSVRRWQLRARAGLIRHAYKKIIVHGEKLKNSFLDNFAKPARDVFVVPHGCLFSFRNGKNGSAPDEEPHTVLFFGRMEEYKGLKYLIETEPLVSRKIKDFKIIVAGKGADLDRHKEALVQNPHFEVHDGYIPNDSVPQFFQRSAAVVLPYIEASQSGIAAMSFAFGKPVIVTDVGSLSEVVRDGQNGAIVPPMDAEKMAQAILELLENREKRLEMGKEASRLANTSLSWEEIAPLTEHVYLEALRRE